MAGINTADWPKNHHIIPDINIPRSKVGTSSRINLLFRVWKFPSRCEIDESYMFIITSICFQLDSTVYFSRCLQYF